MILLPLFLAEETGSEGQGTQLVSGSAPVFYPRISETEVRPSSTVAQGLDFSVES